LGLSIIYDKNIPSSIDNIYPAVYDLMRNLQDTCEKINDNILFEIRVILDEMILNAIKHGNKEDYNKFVKIKAAISKDTELLISVEDSGEGFDHKRLCEAEDNLQNVIDIYNLKETGRGILIIRKLCEKLSFNKKGNRVVAVIRLFV
jgi:serine/threonine-protein kinase RsbW